MYFYPSWMITKVNDFNDDILHPLRPAHHAQRSNDHSYQYHGICTGTQRSIRERCSFARGKREFNKPTRIGAQKALCFCKCNAWEVKIQRYTRLQWRKERIAFVFHVLVCWVYDYDVRINFVWNMRQRIITKKKKIEKKKKRSFFSLEENEKRTNDKN